MMKISPKSFLRNQVFEKNIPKPSKRRKVSIEEFSIPGYKEWEQLIQKNFKMSILWTLTDHWIKYWPIDRPYRPKTHNRNFKI